VFRENTPVIVSCEVDFTVSGTSPSCNGGADGTIDVSVNSGVSPYDFAWSRTSPAGSGSGDGLQITGLSAGEYSVTITDNDGAGCSSETTITITEPAALSLSTNINPSVCGGASGSIDLTVSGGKSPYIFSWTGGAVSSDEDLSNISPGSNYSVQVEDANGCQISDTYAVTGPAAIVITPTTTDVLCHGEESGEISLSVAGGNPGYTYAWSTGASTQIIDELPADTYTVTVTDDTGCTETLAVPVNQPAAPLSASGSVTDVQCAGIPTGAINLTGFSKRGDSI